MSDNKLYWIDRNGQEVDIDTMSIEYLRNVLKMIVRNVQANNENKGKEIGNIEANFAEEQIREWEEEWREDFYDQNMNPPF
jgi:hypothetical protein